MMMPSDEAVELCRVLFHAIWKVHHRNNSSRKFYFVGGTKVGQTLTKQTTRQKINLMYSVLGHEFLLAREIVNC